jgi:dsRNA-specific ribonuclease
MRKLKFLIRFVCAFVLLGAMSFAQTPEKMSYQAVVRDVNNKLVQSTNIGIKISVLTGSATGAVAYSEEHTARTNVGGLISLSIGDGRSTTGSFSSINWGDDTYFLQMEVDPTGGTNYSISSTHQLLSVPYALYAKMADGIPDLDNKVAAYLVNPTTVNTLKTTLGIDNLADVATTGDYEDLSNTPNIGDSITILFNGYLGDPTVLNTLKAALGVDYLADTVNKFISNYLSVAANVTQLKTDLSLHAVATSGSYNDLGNRPSISDTVNTFLYNYFLVPANVTGFKTTLGLHTVATTGSYNDLSNRPSISDTVNDFLVNYLGVAANITNLKGALDLHTVATTGSYDDLDDKPAIPTKLSELERDLDWDTSFINEIQDLILQDDSLFLSLEGAGIHVDSLLKAFHLSTVGLSQFDNDKGYLTFEELIDMATEMAGDQEMKKTIVDLLINEIKTNQYLQDTLKAMIAEDPLKWMDAVYDFAHLVANRPGVKEYLIEKMTTSSFVQSVLEGLLEKGMEAFNDSPEEWLNKIYFVASQAVQNPAVKEFLIDKIESSSFIKSVFATLLEDGMEEFTNNSTEWLTKIYALLNQAVQDPAVKAFLIEKITTSSFVQSVLESLLEKGMEAFNDSPDEWLTKIYTLLNQAVQNPAVKDFLIDKIQTSEFIQSVLDSLLKDGLDEFVSDPVKWLNKAYVAIQEAVKNHPELKQNIIDAIVGLKDDPTVKAVLDVIVSKATEIMATDPDEVLAKINEIINTIVEQNKDLPEKLINAAVNSQFLNDLVNSLIEKATDAIADKPEVILGKINEVITAVLAKHQDLPKELVDAAVNSQFLKDIVNNLIAKATDFIVTNPDVLYAKANEIITAILKDNQNLPNEIITFLSNSDFVKDLLAELMKSDAVKSAITTLLSDQNVQNTLMGFVNDFITDATDKIIANPNDLLNTIGAIINEIVQQNQSLPTDLVNQIISSDIFKSIANDLIAKAKAAIIDNPSIVLDQVEAIIGGIINNDNDLPNKIIAFLKNNEFVKTTIGSLINDPAIQNELTQIVIGLVSNANVQDALKGFVNDFITQATADIVNNPNDLLNQIGDIINAMVAKDNNLPSYLVNQIISSDIFKNMANELIAKAKAAIIDNPSIIVDQVEAIIGGIISNDNDLPNKIITFLKENEFVKSTIAGLIADQDIQNELNKIVMQLIEDNKDALKDMVIDLVADQDVIDALKPTVIDLVKDNEVKDAMMDALGSQLMGGLGVIGSSTFIAATAFNPNLTIPFVGNVGFVIAFASFSLPPVISGQQSLFNMVTADIEDDEVYEAGICWDKLPGAIIVNGSSTNYEKNTSNNPIYSTKVMKLESLVIPEDLEDIATKAVTVITDVIGKLQGKGATSAEVYYVRPYVITRNAGRVYGPDVKVTIP